MNVLIVGSGGREHALAWKLLQGSGKPKLYALPGSAGIGRIAECLSGDPIDIASTLSTCREKKIDLVVIGPEAPLAAGLADGLRSAGIRVFGPTKQAAQLESSKSFAKAFMRRHGIPTARYETYDDPSSATDAASTLDLPLVVKADGLAAGKGVKICRSRRDAIQAVEHFMIAKRLGTAGKRIVLEECLEGPEATVMAFCDGRSIRPLPVSRDYKRLGAGDTGPNTGGMGAFAPVSLPAQTTERIQTDILDRALRGLQADGIDYCGILYCGLMLTRAGPKLLEFNARFGDPETQAVLPLLETDILELFEATIDHKLDDVSIRLHPSQAVAVVLASAGYPEAPQTGRRIEGVDSARDSRAILFHAGTTHAQDGSWATAGGRVLNVVGTGETFEEARTCAYRTVKDISFDGMQYRDDIAAATTYPLVGEDQGEGTVSCRHPHPTPLPSRERGYSKTEKK